MSSELKACPFPSCGSPAMPLHNIGGRSFTRCSNILCSLHQVWTAEDEWNRRTPSPAVLALVEACHRIYGKHTFGAVASDWSEFEQAVAAVEREIGDQFADASKKVEGGSDAHR